MILVTHSGSFHLDEVLATSMLKMIYPSAELIRTRDIEEIKKGDIVYDVGREYNPETNRYDHHQKGFSQTFSPETEIKLSSAGLIYMHFHEQLFLLFDFKKEDDFYDQIYNEIYNEYFLGVDGVDNGVPNDCTYYVRTLNDVIKCFNSPGNEDNNEIQMKRFLEAVKIATEDLKNFLDFKINDYRKRICLTVKSIKESEEIIITKEYINFKDVAVYEKNLGKNIKYVILDGNKEKRIYAVPVDKGSFISKVPLKDKWRGLAGEALAAVSGLKSAIFVHASGFTGGCGSLEDALQMCEISLKEYKI